MTCRKLLLGVAILAAGCTADGPAPRSEGRVSVVATTSIIADMLRQIGGDRLAVTSLMGPGVDPHLYKASEGDLRRLSEADAVFYNGLHLEAKLSDVLAGMRSRKRTVAVADGIPESRLIAPPEFQGAHDPHVWFDVTMWADAVRHTGAGLVEIDPGGAEVYRSRTAAYIGELGTLDAYVKEQAARLTAERRVLVTAHDAFNYFARAYGFTVKGLQGISTATEAGTADVQALAEFVASRRIPALFVESSVPPRTIEAVRAAVRSRGFETTIGGQLYSDALGESGTPAGTYVGMVRHNIDTIVTALAEGAE